MPQFLAQAGRGLVDSLENEIKALDCRIISKASTSILFEANWKGCYELNLYSAVATRVLKPILDFTAYDQEELYGQVKKHDFTKYITNDQTLRVDSTVRDCKIHHQGFVALKTKDAIVDQFNEKFGQRPNVDTKAPHLRIFVRGVKNHFSLSIDTSGEALSFRGYREEAGGAPLRENLAAGLIDLAGWDRKTPLIDPFCGSGTILIEAALKLREQAPGLLRDSFGFQHLLGFDRKLWGEVRLAARKKIARQCPGIILYGFDIDPYLIQMAKRNADRAGVGDWIQFRTGRAEDFPAEAVKKSSEDKFIFITNPPYGERLGEIEKLKPIYDGFSANLKRNFKGSTLFLLSGEGSLSSALRLKATQKIPIYNGNIECRLLKYEMT